MTTLQQAIQAVEEGVSSVNQTIEELTFTLSNEIQQVAAALAAQPDLTKETAQLNSVVESLAVLKQKVTEATSTISNIIADVPEEPTEPEEPTDPEEPTEPTDF